jgi:hypothetical protein
MYNKHCQSLGHAAWLCTGSEGALWLQRSVGVEAELTRCLQVHAAGMLQGMALAMLGACYGALVPIVIDVSFVQGFCADLCF